MVQLLFERWVKEEAGKVRKDFCCGVWEIVGKGVHLQAKRFNENEKGIWKRLLSELRSMSEVV